MVPRPAGEVHDTIRAFFAIELAAAARRAAADAVRALRKRDGADAVRWVRAEALHVTLRFLGDIERAQIAPLVRCVGAEVGPLASFRLGLGPAGLFPSPRRPKVVVLDVSPPQPVVELAAAVERGVVAAGCEPETRPFRAHLTLGRVRGRRWPSVDAVAPLQAEAFDVTEAVLFRSKLHPSGARYTALERIPLRAFNPTHP